MSSFATLPPWLLRFLDAGDTEAEPVDMIGGRLTTETGVPVSTSDRTSQGTIYWTPSQNLGSGIYRLYNGAQWQYFFTTSDVSLGLTATLGKNYDVFLSAPSGTLTLSLSSAWTNDTTRADALALQDAIPVLSSDHTKRWVGTLRASGTNVTEDSKTKRYLWSLYNQVERPQERYDTAHSHTYSSASFREWNAGTGITRLEYVVGITEVVRVHCTVDTNAASSPGGFPEAGGAIDSTTAYNGFDTGLGIMNTSTNIVRGSHAIWNFAGTGYHFVTAIEFGSSTGTANQFSYYDLTCYTMG